MTVMARGAGKALRRLLAASRIDGVIAIGGGTGSWIGNAALADLPFGLAKVLVTTMAGHDAGRDVLVLLAVADIARLNGISRSVLHRAAVVVIALAAAPALPRGARGQRSVAMTMFGLTTAGGSKVRRHLEDRGMEVVIFHANGSGGATMERLLDGGHFDAAADPTFRRVSKLVNAFRETGFDGLINFPSMGEHLEQARNRAHVGQGYDKEVEMIAYARQQDYLTMAYAWSTEQARAMAAVGVDILVPHVGWTGGGLVGASSSVVTVDIACARIQEMIDVGRTENPDVICLAHGGPFADPEDTRPLYEQTDAQGFVGASSVERIPIERSVMAAVRGFKNFTLRP